MQELKPCPFCGGGVSFCECGDAMGLDECRHVACKHCGLFDLSHAADPNNTIETLLAELREKIAVAWNRRA